MSLDPVCETLEIQLELADASANSLRRTAEKRRWNRLQVLTPSRPPISWPFLPRQLVSVPGRLFQVATALLISIPSTCQNPFPGTRSKGHWVSGVQAGKSAPPRINHGGQRLRCICPWAWVGRAWLSPPGLRERAEEMGSLTRRRNAHRQNRTDVCKQSLQHSGETFKHF